MLLQKNNNLWAKGMFVLSALLVLFGIDFVLAPIIFPEFTNRFYSVFADKSISTLADIDQSALYWLFGVSGAIMAGWGITLMGISYRLMKEQDDLLWLTVEAALIVWFVLDSLISYLMGAFFNILFNIFFLILFLIPILGNYVSTRKIIKSTS